MKNYTLVSCENLIERYINQHKGELTIIEEGVLGLGTILLHSAVGKKTIVIREYYLTSWTSGHSVRMYNKPPKKYEKIIKLN